jgi:phage recombination protein Bet
MSPLSPFPTQPREGLPPPTAEIQKQTLLDYLDATGLSHELTEAEITQFVSVCQAFGLSPWKREVYATVYGEGSYRRFSVITGYEVYLKRAERTGRLNGWSSRIDGEGEQMRAIVTIHRKDWAEPLIHEVFFTEAVQRKKDGSPTAFWSKMPRFQLRKVCISQAFRLCFPDELGGLPYDASELPDAESIGIQDKPVRPVPLPPIPDQPATTVPIAENQPKPFTPAAKPIPVVEPEPEVEDEIAMMNRLHDELRSILEDNEDAFTPKHQDWILAKARQATTPSGLERMVAYARKVLKNTASMAATA